jgi:phosphoribosylformylglycinamidine (FGAM) synthase PurS component
MRRKKVIFFKNFSRNNLKVNNKKFKFFLNKTYLLPQKSIPNTNIEIIIPPKIKFCVFAGRKKNLEILHIYIELGLKEFIIDEYHIFDFSRNIDDHLFILQEYNRLICTYANKIFLYDFFKGISISKTDWNPFYKIMSESVLDNDVIIKCDDDILFIDIYSLKEAISDRIRDKISFLIHSNCINNGVCAFYQRHIFPKLENILSQYPKGGILGILFEKPEIANAIHNQFTEDLIKDISLIKKYVIDDQYINSRISINFILLNGCDFKYLKDVGIHDEYELSSLIPEQLLRPNKIKGNLITAHLSYNSQEYILLHKDKNLNNYKKVLEKYLLYGESIPRNIITISKSSLHSVFPFSFVKRMKEYSVKNWINDMSYYIKHIDTGKYIYIDFEKDELELSNTEKTIFEIIKLQSNSNSNVYEIKLGVFYLTKYNCKGKFRNDNLLYQCLKNINERQIEISNLGEPCFIKFIKYNKYLCNDNSNNDLLDVSSHNSNYKNDWIIEKAKNDKTCKNIKVSRFLKNKKFYYKNIDTGDIYTNYYLGWGYEGILS